MRSTLVLFSLITALSSQADTWNAKDYNANSASQQTAAERLLQGRQLDPEASLLDVGCGDGKITLSLAQKLRGNVVGLDKSPTMITFAQTTFADKDHNLSFVVGDAAAMHYNEQFDYVTSFSALQWVPNQKAAIGGMFDALKPGGQLLISMPKHYPECLSNAVLETISRTPYNTMFNRFEPGQAFYGVNEYHAMLRDAGFENVSVSFVVGHNRFESVAAFSKFVKQWLPWAQVFSDDDQKETFMQQVMKRYVAFCPPADDGSVMFLKDQLEATATKPVVKAD